MSRFQSYNENYITREIGDIEREVIALKATQNYGTGQIIPRNTYSAPVASELDAWGWHEVRAKIIFTGANKNKNARGALSDSVTVEDSRMKEFYDCSIIIQKSANQARNVLVWIVEAYCAYLPVPFSSEVLDLPTTCPFSCVFTVTANMGGVVTYERL